MGHRPFLVLADHLTRNGIGVLRYDDRGVGKSSGEFRMSKLDDFASDVKSAITYLLTRKEIDPQNIGLIGHSEGGSKSTAQPFHLTTTMYCRTLPTKATSHT